MSVVKEIEPSSRLHLKASSPTSPHNRRAQQKSGPEVAWPRKVAWGRGVRTFVREGRAVGCGVWRTWRDAESSGTSGSCAPRRYLTPSQLFSSQRPFAEIGESARHGVLSSLPLSSCTGDLNTTRYVQQRSRWALDACLHGEGVRDGVLGGITV